MGKGENAGYQRFLFFPQCFEKASFPDTSKGVIVWERVNMSVSKDPRHTSFESKPFTCWSSGKFERQTKVRRTLGFFPNTILLTPVSTVQNPANGTKFVSELRF